MSYHWVYPSEHHDTREASTFVYGWAPPEAAVAIQGQAILDRSVSGYFATKVSLDEGENPLTLSVCGSSETRMVKRHALPDVDKRINVFGALHYPTSLEMEEAASGDIHPQWFDQPEYRLVKSEHPVVLRSAPSVDASRLFPLQPEAVVCVIGQLGEDSESSWWAIDIGKNQLGWCRHSQWDAASPRDVFQPVRILDTQCQSETRTRIQVPLCHWPAVQAKAAPNGMIVRLPQCQHWADVIRFDPLDAVIQNLTCESDGRDTVALTLDVPKLAGYGFWQSNQPDAYGVQDRGVWVQALPKDVADWRIVLDPGHGGSERGTIAPNGVPEKELNLALALVAQSVLQQTGFGSVLLSRSDDAERPLVDRVAWIEAQQPHIVLSLHHNALPDGRDPLEHQGLSTYYYHGFSRPLALHLLGEMSKALNTPAYGLFEDSLALPRIHTAMSVLIEYGFTTHPDDAERILAPDYPEKAAQALSQSMFSFFQAVNV